MTLRSSARQRGYTYRWDKASGVYKRLNPLCCGCAALGRVEPTTVVDHIEPHEGNEFLFWNQANWQPSCDWHHNAIKQQLERLWKAGTIDRASLRLDSPKAVALSKATPRKPRSVGADGWPIA